ncbi:MAG: 50S ribosomal protein L18, partial [Deltaproteobacteria bacterium]
MTGQVITVEQKQKKNRQRLQRRKRIRSKISGTAALPRMSVYRSLNHCYVQLIDDQSGRTLLGLSTISGDLKAGLAKTGNIEAARKLGEALAEQALKLNISRVVFDRNGF